MNYEDLYQDIQPLDKTLKDDIASLQKLYKAVSREIQKGDIKNLSKDLEALTNAVSATSGIVAKIRTHVFGFDTKAYFESGDFAAQMLDSCAEKGIDVCGEFPVYEMFPYRVRLDMENQDVYLDRKKVQCIRPDSLSDIIKNGQEKLNKASFNPAAFAGELADAYDLAVLKLNRRPQSDIYLTSLYKLLAPMSRFRKDYDQQSFAFDLARLYNSEIEETKNGRRFQFGPSRSSNKSIRILDKNSQEYFLATIRFFE